MEDAVAEIKMVDGATVADWLADGSAALIDVREAEEVAQMRIAGSLSMPLSRLDTAAALATVGPDGGKRLVFQCRTGRRCGVAAERVAEAGFEGTVYRLEGGLKAWYEAGLPLDTAPLTNE